MPLKRESILFRRVLVALDASQEGRALLETAAALATCFESPLMGLYIEDEDMLALADLPVGREVSFTGAQVRDLTRNGLQSHFRSHASRAQRILETAASKQQVEHSFELKRGRPDQEIHRAADESDLIAIGPVVGAIFRSRGEEPMRRLSESAARGLLVVSNLSLTATSGPIAAVFTGTPTGERAVRIAMHVANGLGRTVMVALMPSEMTVQELQQRLQGIVEEPDEKPIVEIDDSPQAVRSLSRRRPGLVIVPEDVAEQVYIRSERAGYPVLILRSDDSNGK